MNHKRLLGGFLLLGTLATNAQTPNQVQPYTYEFYQRLNRAVYAPATRFHSSLKPYFVDDSLLQDVATVNLRPAGQATTTGLWRKLFHDHLVDSRGAGYTAYADLIPEVEYGKETVRDLQTWQRTLGFQAGGTVGKKFSFYTSLYTASGVFADYYRQYTDSNHVIPGESFDRTFGRQSEKNWTNVTTFVSYSPVKFLNITAGQGKTFIGDGYRSMLLSDISANYPYLKLTANLGKIQYMVMYASMKDPGAVKLSYDSGYRKKGAVFHYLDWNVTRRFSLGFFDAMVWSQYDDLGIKRSFDWSYVNPLIFFRSVEEGNGSPDNVLTGFTSKLEVTPAITLYGQLLLDEFNGKQFFKKTGYWANKFAVQGGLRIQNFLTIHHLDLLTEYNSATPYTYAERARIINYSNYDEPLAHPFGANFREGLGILTWSHRRWQLYAEGDMARYGLDSTAASAGKNIFKPYSLRLGNFGNKTEQGIKTTYQYLEGRISFLVNPATNLRIQLSGITRIEKNKFGENTARWFSVGIKSAFRSSYRDF